MNFRELRRLTLALLDHEHRPPVRIDQLRDQSNRWGCTDGRTFIAYAPGAPVETVAHEVAHLVAGKRAGHGPRFEMEQARLADVVRSIRRPAMVDSTTRPNERETDHVDTEGALGYPAAGLSGD